MINVVTILFESITTWLCLHIVFGKKIEKRWLEVGFSGIYVLLSILCSYKVLSKLSLIFIVVWAIIWTKKMFNEKMKNTIVKTIIGIIMIGVLEMLVMCIVYQHIKLLDGEVICLLMSGACNILAIIIYMFLLEKDVSKKLIINKIVLFFTLFVSCFLLCIKIEFENQRKVNVVYLFFFTVLLFAFIYMFKEQKSIYELEKKNLKLQLHNMYGQAYDELLKNVRMRQHDFKNQLLAIKSMNVSVDTMEELNNIQKQYINILEMESKYDKILTCCNNPIISGYVYNLCLHYLKEDIEIDYDINVSSSDVDIRTKEIIEILGVLVSNATEHEGVKKINLTIEEKKSCFTLSVENKCEYISYDELEKMFTLGYSTKGESRGLGLYSVKSIVDRCKGKISVENIVNNNENWIRFSVVV